MKADIIVHMPKIRVFLLILTLIFVGIVGLFAVYYARGYRLNIKTLKFQPSGILVLKSEPDGASVYINGDLEAATNANLSLAPGTYDVEIKKDGYFSWYKRLTIEKEIVTQANISLFKIVPSLTPTVIGAVNVVSSEDGSKIIYSVLPGKDLTADRTGLFELETFSLPLGFNTSPRRISDGDMTGATYSFSPDGRQVLLTISNAIFLLDTGTFTGQNQRVNVASQKEQILNGWVTQKTNLNQSLINSLPPTINDMLMRKTSAIAFSPDNDMILYTASGSATLPDNLIKPLPGASTQTQARITETGKTYIYDIKEDRNFLITDQPATINNHDNGSLPAIRWMSTSRHLLYASRDQVIVMDYDGTNKQVIYSGSYTMPEVFPYSNTTKLLILTNLGAASSPANLYTLTVK